MAAPRKSQEHGKAVTYAAKNRKARHTYFIDDNIEAGIVLEGTEVKSLRTGEANIAESYAEVREGEAWLVNAYIPEFSHGNRHNHQPRRPRKLLMHRREVDRLQAAIMRQGITLVPLSIYFNEDGRAKADIGIARGKKQHDKRQTSKDRDWDRKKARVMKENG